MDRVQRFLRIGRQWVGAELAFAKAVCFIILPLAMATKNLQIVINIANLPSFIASFYLTTGLKLKGVWART